MRTVETLILGGGIAGLSSAWWLARLGATETVLIERENALGRQSTARSAALLRTAGDDALLEEFSLEGARFLQSPPEGFAPRPLVDPIGLVLLGRGAAAPVGAWEHRAPHQPEARRMSARELARVAPHVIQHGEELWHFPKQGRVDVELLVSSFARGAAEAGVELLTGARVTSIERTAARFVLTFADRSQLATERLLLAAGGWAGSFGRTLGSRVELVPTRRHLFITLPEPGISPRAPAVWNEQGSFYSRPERGGLLICTCDTQPGDPERSDVDAAVRESLTEKLAHNLRGLSAGALQDAWSGTRTFAHDERFVLGPDPDVQGLHWAAGLGGHGITASAAAGRLAAELLLERPTSPHFARAFAPRRCAPASAAAAAAEEKTSFDMILEAVGDPARRISIIHEVRAISGLSLAEAKAVVDGAPKPVKTGVSKMSASWGAFLPSLEHHLVAAFTALEDALAAAGPRASTRPAQGRWSALEIAEHVTLTDHFLLLLATKLARKARARAERGETPASGPPDLNALAVLASSNFRWDSPPEMLPTGNVELAAVRETLTTDRESCLALLRSLPRGAGTRASARFSPLDTRLDVYQFLELIALHAERHARQIQRTLEDEPRSS